MQDMTRKLRYLFVLLFLGVSGAAFAQTGAMSGTVYDEKKEPIIGAVVQVFQAGVSRGGDVTNEDGKYNIKPLNPGTNFEVHVKYASYREIVLKNVIVSPDRTTYQNYNMEVNAREMAEVVVKEYKVPLIKKDEPGSTTTFTAEQISKMPTRSTNDVAALAAGTYQQKSGSGINIAGARTGGTLYVVDGVQINSSSAPNFPPGAIEQMSVITSGISAKYGDASGGVISITTKGGAAKHTGEIGVEHSVDGYDRTYAYFSVSGPLLKKKVDSVNKKNLLGYSLSGNYLTAKDNDPNYFNNYTVKGDKLKQIQDNPLVQVSDITGRPTFRSAAEYIRMSDLEASKTRINSNVKNGRLVGKLDYQVSDNMNIVVGGNFNYTNTRLYDTRYSLFAPDAIPKDIGYNGLGYIRFTQRFGKSKIDQTGDEKKTPLISNAFYTLQADYSVYHRDLSDPKFKHNPFYYNYIGKFDFVYDTTYFLNVDDKTQRTATLLRSYNSPVAVNFTASDMNPLLANYTKQFYQLATGDQYPNDLSDITAGNGLLNGAQPNYVYGSNFYYNVGATRGGYSYSNNEQYSFHVETSFDFQPKKTRHSIEFGLDYQQRAERSYGITAASQGGNAGLWSLMRLLTNRHILDNDIANPTYLVNGQRYTYDQLQQNGILLGVYDTVLYNRDTNFALQSTFDRNLRKKLGLNPDGTDYLNVDALDPSLFSLDMFSADEIVNQGSNFTSWYGYDYTGKRLNGQVNFDDFFTQKDANGNYTRNIGAFRPNYIAGYIQDKFELPNGVLFNVGVRVDRFDANTKQLRDPYSLYGVNTVSTSNAINTVNGGKTPENIKGDYVVYVADNAATTPTVIGYRSGDDWYDATGKFVADPSVLKALSGRDPQPYLIRTGGTRALTMQEAGYNPSTSFTDYTPQVNVMPRINFTFPIAEQSMFYAHYDVYVMRPKDVSEIYVSPIDYLYLNQRSGQIINNPGLKPEKVFDYELGFQQVLSQNSAITINGTYKERKDMIQIRPYLNAWPTTYYTFGNRDFMTYKSFSLKYDLRRVNHMAMGLSYTLQFSEGTGSSSTSGNGGNGANTVASQGLTPYLIGSSLPNLRFAFPLDIDSRHVLAANVDYRYDKGEGPVIGNTHFLENAGANFVFRARSGEPYTRYEQPGQRIVAGGVQGSRLPWHYGMDLRVDKSFPLNFGKKADGIERQSHLGMTAFVYIQNLFNTREILGVHGYTGRPDDDGWMSSPQGQIQASTKTDPTSYKELYLLTVQDQDKLNYPRRINIGLSLNF